jgi:GMP synthase-like glutamine amidotransferase
MQKAVDNLAAALKLAPQLKVVAICYGHQLILHHFGAEVVKKEPIDRL